MSSFPNRPPAWLLVSALAAATPAHADDTQAWIGVGVQGPIAGDLVYAAEAQSRLGEDVSEPVQSSARAAIGWRLSPRVTIFQGYAVIDNPRDGPSVGEDRSFQQISATIADVGRGTLSSRTRLEQRWRSDGRDVGWRLRQQLRIELPLADGETSVAGVASAEAFWNLNDTDWGGRARYDRVRAFAGLRLPLAGRSAVEVGYLNQTIDDGDGATVSHVASVSLQLRR